MKPALFMAILGACAFLSGSKTTTHAADNSIILQSTTSTANSGLYDYILPQFERISGIKVHVVAVGTGQALRNARNGDGDVLLVHAKEAEEKFVVEGYGVRRFDVMYNDFIIVGPPSDPAKVAASRNGPAALRKIAHARALFASRGDDSGTHKKERQLWALAQTDPVRDSGTWYLETGSGMGTTLNVGIGKGAYVLTDRATWISFGNRRDFRIHVEGGAELHNQYGIALINPAKHPRVNAEAGQAFIDWILGPKGQSAIASYKLEGQQLFFPNAREP